MHPGESVSLLRIPQSIYSDLCAHAEETYPRECCGALLGRITQEGWRVERMQRAVNACDDTSHDRYEIAAAELVKIAQLARERGLEIAGFYHSHPDHPARWSAIDLAEAHWLGCCYVITEVARGRVAHTSAFLLAGTTEEDKRFEAEELEIGS